ncbi:hypothetical protein XA68_17437 [Ophiocordyceps unilateralis]|uniref:NTF2 domain-containing protein n=1 Tax=Ophiocordyceps unilateralis TaxID=268505 RepID=A0A2A9P4T5_OPHUN|nr:hypothetical protein XA68_17437 [Ophiocordyceps unilateralis]
MATNGNFAHQEQYKSADQYPVAATGADSTAAAASGNSNLSKDEVGWFFVEQYYTTLSKSPEKLHLFYGKRSQFVQGLEAEVANVSVGRQVIQERIKQLDFQDCKVRVSNVDSQASFDNIVIQVIGETSNKGAEPKKFVQTFVLAQQPSGYFVLNDILRYIKDEHDDEPAEAPAEAPVKEVAAPAATAPAVSMETAAPAPEGELTDKEAVKDDSSSGLNASVVNKKLEEVVEADKAVNGGDVAVAAAEPGQASDTKAGVKSEAALAADPVTTAHELAVEDAEAPEKPQDPSPTPVPQPAPPVHTEPVVPAEPPAPPKPMTWASRAAAAAGPRPVVPLPKTATSPASTQSRTPVPGTAAPPATVATAAAAQQPSTPTAPAAESMTKESSGWQTAGADSKRQNRPQSMSGNFSEKEGTMGYVKYVTDKVQDTDLRNVLTAHGELTYFDINRQKNCAFVEYKTVEGYQAAVSANPHVVNGENIVVEPRRPKATAYGGSNYGSGRGSLSGRGRGGYDGTRGGGQGNTRGNFPGQSRGRGGIPRGRGGPQASNA